jgi:diguanylate cyclase (GGDEF)-like protein
MLQIKRLQDELMAQKDIMEQMATTDALTAIPNLRCFRDSLDDEFNRAMRYGECLSLIMVDLDNFKIVNDDYGHPAGDSVLRESAAIMVDVMRKVDLVARYGGEEFVVVMPHTDLNGASLAAERLRTAFEQKSFEALDRPGQLTASFGVSTFTKGREMSMDDLIAEADEALYEAKQGGRNRVEIAGASKDYLNRSGCD